MAKLGNTAKQIIEFIWAHGESTKREILDAIRPPGRSKWWGNSYFLIGRGNGRHLSLFRRGFIVPVGIDRATGARLWDITPAALEVVPDPFLASATDDDGFPTDDFEEQEDETDDGFEPPDTDEDWFGEEADRAAYRHFEK